MSFHIYIYIYPKLRALELREIISKHIKVQEEFCDVCPNISVQTLANQKLLVSLFLSPHYYDNLVEITFEFSYIYIF